MSDKTNMETKKNDLPNSQLIFGKDIKLIAKAILILIIVCVFSYKILIFNTDSISVDFATLISVLLALFSIAMSVAFYHMANVSSQKFYSDSFTFTKDIAESLAKIDSGFGEKLTNLYTNYENFRNDVYKEKKFEVSEEIINETNQEIQGVLNEKDEIINTLIEKSKLNQNESQHIKDSLFSKDKQLKDLSKELERLQMKLNMQEMQLSSNELSPAFFRYITNNIFPMFNVPPQEFINLSSQHINRIFENLVVNDLRNEIRLEMQHMGLLNSDKNLTRRGVNLLKGCAEKLSLINRE